MKEVFEFPFEIAPYENVRLQEIKRSVSEGVELFGSLVMIGDKYKRTYFFRKHEQPLNNGGFWSGSFDAEWCGMLSEFYDNEFLTFKDFVEGMLAGSLKETAYYAAIDDPAIPDSWDMYTDPKWKNKNYSYKIHKVFPSSNEGKDLMVPYKDKIYWSDEMDIEGALEIFKMEEFERTKNIIKIDLEAYREFANGSPEPETRKQMLNYAIQTLSAFIKQMESDLEYEI